MNLPIEDQYPSTSDYGLPRIAGGQRDPVIDVLVGGRQRVNANHSTSVYIGTMDNDWPIARLDDGTEVLPVCAIGSLASADGLTGEELDDQMEKMSTMSTWAAMEALLSEAAKEAIALLNAEALRRFPDAEDYGNWSGPFEFINQANNWAFARITLRGEDPFEYVDGDEGEDDTSAIQVEVKKEIVDIYDAVIRDRSGGLVVA